MPMKGLIILFFYQKKRVTEQVRNDDAMENKCWYSKSQRTIDNRRQTMHQYIKIRWLRSGRTRIEAILKN